MKYAWCFAIALGCTSTSAFAIEPPALPPTAAKLFKTQIIALYDGRTYKYRNYTKALLLTGVVKYDFTEKTVRGTYNIGEDSGRFRGSIRMRGDRFCYTLAADPEVCVSVYIDDNTVYEVNNRLIVTSVNREKLP